MNTELSASTLTVPHGLSNCLGTVDRLPSMWGGSKRSPEVIKKKFAVVFVTVSDAMDFGGFTDCVVFLR